MPDSGPANAANLLDVERRLAQAYGRPRWSSHGPALDELVATILSQHTSDRNSGRAFASLRARFPSWSDVLAADEMSIAEAIESGGLANLKAPRIQRVLRAVESESGCLTLNWLSDWPQERARDWLVQLPGVGPKTAACVLLFSLGFPTMPVDTHVHRVGRRLGLIPEAVSADEAHAVLDRQIGPDRDRVFALHLNLIRHGRATCRARVHACGDCVLNDVCPSAGQARNGQQARSQQ